MDRLKTGLVNLLILMLIWLTIEGVITVRQARISLKYNADALYKTVNHADESVMVINKAIRQQVAEFEDPQAVRGRKLLLQSGDDLKRTILKVNVALDQLNKETLPRANDLLNKTAPLIDNSTEAVSEIRKQIGQNGEAFAVLLSESTESVKAFRALLEDPKVREALDRLNLNLDASEQLLKESKISVADFNKYLPGLMAGLRSTSENTAEGTKHLALLIGSFNEKPTRLQKIYRTIISLGIVAAKFAVQ